MPVERFLKDANVADLANPEGLVLNTGQCVVDDDTMQHLQSLGLPAEDILENHATFQAPAFNADDSCAASVWTYPQFYVLACTEFRDILPDHNWNADVKELPYTWIVALPRRPNVPPSEFVSWVLSRSRGVTASPQLTPAG
jgi:hypothetical protein